MPRHLDRIDFHRDRTYRGRISYSALCPVVAEWVVGDECVATASQIASKCRPTTHIRDACTSTVIYIKLHS